MANKKPAATKERMTIHRGLAELKLLDSRIDKTIVSMVPVGIHQKDKKIENHIDKGEFETTARAQFQSATDLIARKGKIKSAIVDANGRTMVKIGGKRMTIADAITMKGLVIFKKKIVERLKTVQRDRLAAFNKANEAVATNAQSLLVAALGKDNVKTGDKDVEAIRKPYIEANEVHLFDPLKVQSKIDELDKEISTFEMEVDAVLSEINAITFIEI